MRFTSKITGIRITPRKTGLIGDAIRGKKVIDALNYLAFSPRKRTASVFANLIKTILANAENSHGVKKDTQTTIDTLLIGQGPTLKRFRARSKGSASKIHKKTSHITMTVSFL